MICPSDLTLELFLERSLLGADQDKVENHVEGCAECQERLSVLVDCLDAFPFDRGPHSSPPRNLGERTGLQVREFVPEEATSLPTFPGYDVLSELGRGGMGIVYKARQKKLSRTVAIKMVRSADSQLQEVERIRIEAEAIAQIHHANIVQIYEIGDNDGRPFFSMEYVHGGRLEEKLQGLPQRPAMAAQLVEVLARAIHVAHERGIVHRDLKPSNVLLEVADGDTNSYGTPKISDFGLAKRIKVDSGLTMTGVILGSPSYMSPEQTLGDPRRIGPATDIWALGVILYEMLTGRPPFQGDDPMSTMRMIAENDPVPPAQLQPKIPRDLETVCLKTLRKEPDRRYVTAVDLAEDLRRFLNGEPILARPIPAWQRCWKWVKRRPVLAASLAFFLVNALALLGFGISSEIHSRAAERRESLRVQGVQSEGQADLLAGQRFVSEQDWQSARMILSQLCVRLEAEPRLSDLHEKAQSLLEQANRGQEIHEAQQADRQRLEEFRKARADSLFHDLQMSGLDLTNNVKATRASAAASLRCFMQPNPWTLSPLPAILTADEKSEIKNGCYEMLLVLAEAEAHPLRDEDPTAQVQSALDLLERAVLLREPTPDYYRRRAICLDRLGKKQEASDARAQAERMSAVSAFDHFSVGLELCKRLNTKEAARHFDQALRQDPGYFEARVLLAVCHLRDKNFATAKVGLTACLDEQPEFAWLFILRGFACGELGAGQKARNRKEAREQFEAAEEDFQRALRLDLNDDMRYILLLNRGTMYFRQDELPCASADFEQAIRLKPKQFHAYASLAQVYQTQGDRDQAAKQLARAIELDPEVPDLYRARAHLFLTDPKLSADRRKAVLADFAEAIRLTPAGNPAAAEDHLRCGSLWHRVKDYKKALASFDAALKIVPDHPEVHRLRLATLLELRRYDEVLESCKIVIAKGKPTASHYELRGLAYAGQKQFAKAIEDYTQALALDPKSEGLYRYRGWAYLVTESYRLALRDFDQAIKLNNNSADALSGRGFARVMLGQIREGVVDVEASLRHGEPSHRLLHNASRTLAQAAANTDTINQKRRYEERACALLADALKNMPAAKRNTYWETVVLKDAALIQLRRGAAFSALAGQVARAK